MIFKELIKTNREEFDAKVKLIAHNLGIPNPNWLYFVMYFETAKTLDHTIQSPATNATGLLQFMPSTSKSLGTTVDKLKAMTNIQQLDYVERYLAYYKGLFKSFVDLYLAVFFPLAIGKPDDFIIETKRLKASVIAKQNPVFDLNKDQKITKAEIKKRLYSMVPDEYKAEFV